MLRFKQFLAKLDEAWLNPKNPLEVEGIDHDTHRQAIALGGIGTRQHQAYITRRLGRGNVKFQRLYNKTLLATHQHAGETHHYIAFDDPHERSGVGMRKATAEDLPKTIKESDDGIY